MFRGPSRLSLGTTLLVILLAACTPVGEGAVDLARWLGADSEPSQ